MPYIKRNLEKIVQEVTLEYPVMLLTGPRQVGKTTMLMKLMEGSERSYVTLDDLSERALAKSDPELYSHTLKSMSISTTRRVLSG